MAHVAPTFLPPSSPLWSLTSGRRRPMGPRTMAQRLQGRQGVFGKTWGSRVMPHFIMAFTRNTGTNVFPMILGLFLEIGGTSSRILNTLSNAGACKILSEDAVAHAVNLVQGSNLFYIIFDNINIFLRKSQQRLFNKNTMIHATNAAVISLPDADPLAEDLEAKQKRRGKRAAATGTDIIPTDDDEAKMFSSFVGLVMTLILAYCPGSKEWEGRDAILKAVEDMIASDRPLPPKSTEATQGFLMLMRARRKGYSRLHNSVNTRFLSRHHVHDAERAEASACT
ncbi:hypothetical protein B0H13DRAFT_1879289 [Mycena leptocephala]|nr:hypothetical protein B0H13DRAFT_1879289 [Mycena leptocephala]